MNGCVNFPLFDTMPNKQGAYCNPSRHLTQIEANPDMIEYREAITTLLTLLLHSVCLTQESDKQENGNDVT